MDADDILKLVLLLLGLLIVLPIISMMVFFPVMGGMMGWPMGGEFGGMYMWGVGWLFPLAFLAALGFGVYWLLRNTGVESGTGTRDPAIQALREAYASGEIDDEEYEQRLAKLEDESDRR